MIRFIVTIAVLALIIGGVIVIVNFFSSEPEQPKKTFWDQVAEDDRKLRAEPEFKDIKQTEQPVTAEPQPQVTIEPEPEPTFEELTEIEKVEAERLFEFAIQQRKIGRLPVTGFKPMVDACRDIIQKFPGSEFDYKARRMLADIPQRYRKRYKITEEETDLTRFYK